MAAVNVNITTVNCGKYNRNVIVNCFSEILQTTIKRVEDLCTGSEYCQMMDILFPGSVNLRKVKMKAENERDRLGNFKILQSAFDQLEVTKSFPADKIINGKLLHNLDFAKWFLMFFTANFDRHPYDAEGMRAHHSPVTEPIQKSKRKFPISPTKSTRKQVQLDMNLTKRCKLKPTVTVSEPLVGKAGRVLGAYNNNKPAKAPMKNRNKSKLVAMRSEVDFAQDVVAMTPECTPREGFYVADVQDGDVTELKMLDLAEFASKDNLVGAPIEAFQSARGPQSEEHRASAVSCLESERDEAEMNKKGTLEKYLNKAAKVETLPPTTKENMLMRVFKNVFRQQNESESSVEMAEESETLLTLSEKKFLEEIEYQERLINENAEPWKDARQLRVPAEMVDSSCQTSARKEEARQLGTGGETKRVDAASQTKVLRMVDRATQTTMTMNDVCVRKHSVDKSSQTRLLGVTDDGVAPPAGDCPKTNEKRGRSRRTVSDALNGFIVGQNNDRMTSINDTICKKMLKLIQRNKRLTYLNSIVCKDYHFLFYRLKEIETLCKKYEYVANPMQKSITDILYAR